ncbi:XerD/XerC family integrase [Halalkaliarchaeum sp. AArc-CO]|uniref:tyrosine-type recombinase/integrase n=1 Tax=Halalkaliarchaeum sp. AArc-CO TaxID=2866381 RepID=UPI00217F222B|nr:tyrosine-type recombinase/integrase [Halalkaliarchaeum sp. AArc-CO]UWG50152.1 XerD/XerC family integrase [Halalkaliarchaeum sp. AArc-CO]
MSTTEHVNVERSLQNLEEEVHPENAEAVRRFIDHQAAEGISEVQQDRQVQSFKALLTKFAPDGFRLQGASEDELKTLLARLNRSDYAESTKIKFKGAVKKFYKVENGGHEHPSKVGFFSVNKKKATPVTRDDLFTDEERKRLFRSFTNTRDRAFTMVLYESAARPGELLNCNINDFSTGKGDFIFLEGSKGTPDRNNQLVRSGRTLREWISQHPLGGEIGDIEDSSAPLWVKNEQQSCEHCGEIPRFHDDGCSYEPDLRDRMNYNGFLNRFKDACERADIPENKQRPYNLRHTRLTEVATFMGYEQLNKFAGWVPGSNRAKVYVHLNSDDVNKAIREEYGLDNGEEEDGSINCSFCGTENQSQYSECRNCGRPLSLEEKSSKEEKRKILERLAELEEQGVLENIFTDK